ncbi:MAG TPA: LysR family transcriptional regulator [Gemmatirosa sp.]|nr:LysR family transcriptional regulator [Gemmatirosa sp.]
MSLTLDALAVLDAIATYGSFAAAAKALHRVPSAVSYVVKQLELDVGFAVFDRSGQGARMTAAGRTLLEHGRGVLAQAAQAEEAARQVARAEAGHLMVSAVEVGARHRVGPALLDAWRTRFPRGTISVLETDSRQQREGLLHGAIDVAVTYAGWGGDARIAAEPITDDPLACALLAPGHPLAARRALRLRDLADVPLVLFRRSSNPPAHDAIHAAFARAAFTPPRVQEVSGSLATWALVGQGAGWAPKPRSYRADPPPGTVAVRLLDFRVPFGLELLWRRDERAPHVLAFVELVRAMRERERGARRRGAARVRPAA